jgi:hypothetical protein
MSKSQFAAGRKAVGICDRCGWTWRLVKLRKETVNLTPHNLLVCPDCWDPDHPQNMAGRIDYMDPQALRNPRTDTSTGSDLIDLYNTQVYTWEFDTYELGREEDFNNTFDWAGIGSSTVTWNTTGSSGAENGTATLVTAGADEGMDRIIPAQFSIEFNFDSNLYDVCRIRMRVVAESNPVDWEGTFAWRRSFDSQTSKEIQLPRPGAVGGMGDQWFILEYDLAADPTWSSKIKGVRFTPYSAAGNTVEIDYIRLEKK